MERSGEKAREERGNINVGLSQIHALCSATVFNRERAFAPQNPVRRGQPLLPQGHSGKALPEVFLPNLPSRPKRANHHGFNIGVALLISHKK